MATIDDLRAILARMRYVKTGDILLADDHNSLVDFDKTLVDYLGGLENRVTTLEQQVAQMVKPPEEYGDALPLLVALNLFADAVGLNEVYTGIWNACRYKLDDYNYAFTGKWIDDPFVPECWTLGLNKRDVAKMVVDAGKTVMYSTNIMYDLLGYVGLRNRQYIKAPLEPGTLMYTSAIVFSVWNTSWMLDELQWAEQVYGENNAMVVARVMIEIVGANPQLYKDDAVITLLMAPTTNDKVSLIVGGWRYVDNGLYLGLAVTCDLANGKRHVIASVLAFNQSTNTYRPYIVAIDEDGNVVCAVDMNFELTTLYQHAVTDAVCSAWRGTDNQPVYNHEVPFAGRAVAIGHHEQTASITPTLTLEWQVIQPPSPPTITV